MADKRLPLLRGRITSVDTYEAPQSGGGAPPKMPALDPKAHRTTLLQQLDAITQQVKARRRLRRHKAEGRSRDTHHARGVRRAHAERIAGGVVREVRFEGRGCALSRAAASIMTTMVCDRTIDASRALAAAFEQFVKAPPDAAIPDDLGELRAFAGVRSFRSHRVCATLGLRALARALESPA